MTESTGESLGDLGPTWALEVSATGAAADAVRRHVPDLVGERFASRLFAQDATLWGPDAEEESAKRLAWTGLGRSSRPLVGEVAALRDDLRERGIDRVVLCGMGGSSLAPEVITATAGVPLVVLDSSDPDVVRRALTELERTVVVVSSKSGSTVETDSQRRAFEHAFREAGLDPAGHVVVVTDPGSPLETEAREAGYRVVNADPSVGGRYSALTAFGLVPSGLAGVDVEQLLDEAESVADQLADDDEANPALRLGAAIAGTDPLRDKLVLVDDGSGIVGFADWAEQLVAESTGKLGTGLLPVVVEGPTATEVRQPAGDVLVARLTGDSSEDPQESRSGADGEADGGDDGGSDSGERTEVAVSGPLGAQMLLWEAATAVAGRLLGINPFDQPDVESAKKAARGMLDEAPDAQAPDLVDGDGAEGIEIRGTDGLLNGVTDLPGAVAALLGTLDPQRGYLAVMAYLDREADADLATVREPLARRTGRPVTFGWGPRFLHSTGQYHKGGPATGAYLQLTGEPAQDLDVPDRPFTFGRLIAAQAAGDATVLADHGRPVLRLHLRSRAALARVREVLGEVGA